MNLFSIISYLLLSLHTVFAISYEEALSEVGKDGLLHITDKNYKKLMKNNDYGLVVLLTADDPRVGCTLCVQFTPSYKAMAQSYYNNLFDDESLMINPIDSKDDKSKIIFGISDYLSAKEFFGLLQLTAVPRLFYYAPGKGPQLSQFTNEFSFLAVENTDGFIRWISGNVPGLDIKFLKNVQPPSKSILLTLIIILLSSIIVLYKFQSQIFSIVQSKKVWEFLSIGSIILLISGYMYNQIRNAEMYKVDKDGVIHYFAQGHNVQFGTETQIMSIIYTTLFAGLFIIIQVLPQLKNPRNKLILSITASTIMFIAYSYIIAVYKLKSPSYPFQLLRSLVGL